MTAQKIPLFSGLIQPCHDGIGVAEELTPIFTPPDKAATAGTQAFYLLHLWLKPAFSSDFDKANFSYRVQAYRGSVPADKRPLWSSKASILQQITGDSAAATQVQGGDGVPVKILDGYPVRGNMFVEFVSFGAEADAFAFGEGTRIWGYYQRVGEGEGEPIRFIGEPPAGTTFDTGMPLQVEALGTAILHTFQPDKIDEISLQFVENENALDHGAMVLVLAGADGVGLGGNTAIVSVYPQADILGAANCIRDPKSPSNIFGVFGNNPLLKTLRVLNQDATREIFVYGRFSRH